MGNKKKQLPPWECESPPPEKYDEGHDDIEWPFEGIIAEEINPATHKHVYEVRWQEWSRPDGSNTTWYTEEDLNEDFRPALREYKKNKGRYLNKVSSESRSMDIYRYLDIHNAETWLEAQAYQQKLKNFKPRDFYQEKELETNAQTPRQASVSLSRAPTNNPSSARHLSSFASASSSGSGTAFSRANTQSQERLQSISRQHSGPSSSRSTPSSMVKMEHLSVNLRVGRPGVKKYLSPRQKLAKKWNKIAAMANAEPIEFVNEVDDEEVPVLPSGFQYVEATYVLGDGVDNSSWDEFLGGCDCDNNCEVLTYCHCVAQGEYETSDPLKRRRNRLAYNEEGLMYPEFIEVFECNKHCACAGVGGSCPNRVAQRSRDIPVQIFKTHNGRGWGARSTVDIPTGKILGFYTGTLVNRVDAMQESRGYTFDVDGREDRQNLDSLEGKYSIDAYTSGNWTRFINHSCSANLRVVNVTIDIAHIPYHALVARYDIPAGRELTIDYDPGAASGMSTSPSDSFDDDKKICLCESESCRGWMRV